MQIRNNLTTILKGVFRVETEVQEVQEVQYMPGDIEENKWIACLSYLGILFLIPLLAKKDSPYSQFHAKQGIVLFLGWIAASVINVIPILGQIIFVIASLFFLVLFFIGVINALSGKAKELPLIGQLGHKFNF